MLRICLAAALATFFAMPAVHAAKPVQAPVEALVSPHNRIAVLTVETLEGADRIEFNRISSLYGETPESIILRGKPELVSMAEAGEKYLAVYTRSMKDPITRDSRMTDPEGPRLVDYYVVRQALFPWSAELESLFVRVIKGGKKHYAAELSEVLAIADSKSPSHQQLGAFELFMRRDLFNYFTPEQGKTLERLIDSSGYDEESSTLLLRSAALLREGIVSGWIAEKSRKIIDSRGSQYDLAGFTPGLVVAAANTLKQFGGPEDFMRLESLMVSNAPGVAKAAMRALLELDTETAEQMMKKALSRKELHRETRRSINHYLNHGVLS